MLESVRTSTSTFGIWAIIVVAMIVLAVWLVGVSVADNIQTRESRRWWQRVHGSEPEPAVGSAVVSEVPGQRRGDQAVTEPIAAQPSLDGAGDFRRDAAEADWRTDAPTRPDLPAQAGPSGWHAMPTQRTGDTDRAERSLAGPEAAGQDDDLQLGVTWTRPA